MNRLVITREYADTVRSLIEDEVAYLDRSHYELLAKQWDLDQHGTSHFSLMGRDGAIFSSTSTVSLE